MAMSNMEKLERMLSRQAVKQREKTGHVATPVHVCEPAHSIITKLGGVREVARWVGLSAAAVTRWQRAKLPREKGSRDTQGCGGVIPENRRDELLAMAKDRCVRLTRKEFNRADD